MRCNWQRWLWGLIPLMLLGWAAITFERDRVQADLNARAKEALADEDSPWANVSVEGRDVTLTGNAVQDDEPPRAADTIRGVWGVRVVENRATLPPVVEPFTWSARKRGDRLRLSGHVPDRATRQTVVGLTKAAMPSAEVTEKLRTARGVKSPDTWLAGLSFALKQLSMLRKGEAKFEDLTLTISGEAEDPAAFKTINTALKSGLPKGITLASARIAPPVVSPFTWSAQFAGGQLVLAGHVAGGESTRQELVAAAKSGAPDANMVDRMEFAEGAPQGWTNVAVAVLKELPRLDSGTADMKDAALTVGGIAQDEAQAQAIRSALRAAIPSSFAVVDQIRVREVKAPEPPPPPPPAPTAAPAEPAPSISMVSPPTADPVPKAADTPAPDQTPAPEPKTGPSESKAAEPAPAPPPQAEAAPAQPAAPPVPEAPSAPTVSAAEPAPPAAPEEPKASPEPAPQPEQQAASASPAPAEPQPATPAEPPAAAPAEPPAAPAVPEPRVAMPQDPPAQGGALETPACQEELAKIASAGHIHFATDSATLDDASFETLDRLAAAAKACPGARIAIEGHTDAEGRAEYNKRLSVRRAQAVVGYLVKAGASRRQFVTIGYGPTRPAAPNDTEENMAKNRRIEFNIQQQ